MNITKLLEFLRDSPVRLKGLQKTVGTDGHGWHAKVYFEGKHVGTAHDPANGAPVYINVNDEVHKYLVEEGKKMHKFDFEHAEHYLSQLANATMIRKDLMPNCKKHILVQDLTNHSDFEYTEYSTAPTSDALRKAREKFGLQRTILNDLIAEIKL